jgi:Flp pilus assembly protein TadB
MAKIQITGLEETLVDWGIDQALGTKIGGEITAVLNPIASGIASGLTTEQALLQVAINLAGDVKTTNPTVVAVEAAFVAVAEAVEGGASITAAFTSVLGTLTGD